MHAGIATDFNGRRVGLRMQRLRIMIIELREDLSCHSHGEL
jgi:hypothetical protein